MIEDRFITTDLSVARPVASLKQVSHDPSLTHLLEVGDGRTMTAVQLQWEYLTSPRSTSRSARAATPTPQTSDVLERWESVLTRLERDPFECADELDWVAKLKLLDSYRERDGLAWSDAKLHLIDLQYADLRPEKGLYHRLRQVGPDEAPGRRRRGRGGHARAPGGHPGLLPRPLPEQVRRQHRRRLLGLGHLRPARPRVAAAGARRSTRCAAARRTSAPCSTATTPRSACSRRSRALSRGRAQSGAGSGRCPCPQAGRPRPGRHVAARRSRPGRDGDVAGARCARLVRAPLLPGGTKCRGSQRGSATRCICSSSPKARSAQFAEPLKVR